MIADPVGSGFVASFPRPGGNATGFVVTEGSLGGKWLQLLKEIAPGIERVAMLYNGVVEEAGPRSFCAVTGSCTRAAGGPLGGHVGTGIG